MMRFFSLYTIATYSKVGTISVTPNQKQMTLWTCDISQKWIEWC